MFLLSILTNIPKIQGLLELYCSNCPWLNIKNEQFEINIKKLKRIQEFIRKIIMSKRLMELIPKIMAIYYHPECKGGYMHKKQMLVDLQWR